MRPMFMQERNNKRIAGKACIFLLTYFNILPIMNEYYDKD